MKLVAALLAILVLFSGPAAAVEPRAAKTEQLALIRYANCLVANDSEAARRMVLEGWEAGKLVRSDLLRDKRCTEEGRSLGFSADILRAAMAQALIARDLTPTDSANIAAAPALSYDLPFPVRTIDDKGRPVSTASIERQRKVIALKTAHVGIQQFGECVARANPAAVPSLAASEPVSVAELTALKAFDANLSPCVPKGIQLELDKPRLRSAITLAYYRLAMAARTAQSVRLAQ